MTEYRREFEDEDDLMNYLFETGVLELDGVDPDGEFIVKPNMERAKEVCPEFHAELVLDRDKDLMELWRAGVIEISYNEDLDPMVSFTEEGRKVAEQMGYELD